MTNHLIHIGFPKTGSKSLQSWFERHPGFAFTQWGIAGTRDVRRLGDMLASPGDARCAVTSFEGFVTPVADHRDVPFADSRALAPRDDDIVRVAEGLAGLFRGARILIVTRGFESLCRSCYAEVIGSGGHEEFADFCRHFFQREDGSLTIGYDFVIGLYERLFGADKVLVLPFELLRDDPARFAREIEAAAGVEQAALIPGWVHRSPSWEALLRTARLRRALRGAPGGRVVQRVLLAAHARLWTPLASRLTPSRGGVGVPEPVPADVLARFRGSAAGLRSRPFYRGLEAEYLLDTSQGRGSAVPSLAA